ncbi:MAG: LysR family transcriptional regulator [Gammaproteobacteria bacterium]|nr:LysR family transcriptional regulator [Gammaproteobacteria bacterium]
MITLKQITYALALEKTLHFRKAAEHCSISQSAFSTALSEMEKQLGFQVFERNNKKVLITPLGQQILDQAHTIQLQMNDLYHLADTHKEPLSTPVSIGVIPTISPFLLPLVLPALHSRYPKLELSVHEEQSHVLVEQVKRGNIDMAILALPFDIEGLLTFKFWQEDFYWITYSDDKLAKKKKIAADEIDLSKLMLLNEGHCLKDHALAACHITREPTHSMSATSLGTLVQLVAGKMGSTLVPEMALSQLIELNPALAKVPLAEAGPHREIVFIARPNYPSVGNIELLMKLFSKQLKQSLS